MELVYDEGKVKIYALIIAIILFIIIGIAIISSSESNHIEKKEIKQIEETSNQENKIETPKTKEEIMVESLTSMMMWGIGAIVLFALTKEIFRN